MNIKELQNAFYMQLNEEDKFLFRNADKIKELINKWIQFKEEFNDLIE